MRIKRRKRAYQYGIVTAKWRRKQRQQQHMAISSAHNKSIKRRHHRHGGAARNIKTQHRAAACSICMHQRGIIEHRGENSVSEKISHRNLDHRGGGVIGEDKSWRGWRRQCRVASTT